MQSTAQFKKGCTFAYIKNKIITIKTTGGNGQQRRQEAGLPLLRADSYVGLERIMSLNIKKKVSMSEYLKRITKEELRKEL